MRSLVRYCVWLVLDGGWFQWLWLFLVTIGVFLIRYAQLLISFFYYICPFPDFLDRLFQKTAILQYLFSFRLQAPMQPDTATIIKSYGYNVEHHIVETEDGFVLSLFRVCPSNISAKNLGLSPSSSGQVPSRRSPVLIMHGLMMCSDVWVISGKKSLPFALCDAGYDVWLGNNRGNRYSCKHRTLDPRTEKFWNWSLDEFARYDIPSQINYIKNVTLFEKISYVGFSQGTAQGFAAFSIDPNLAKSIEVFIALAPAVTVKGLSNPIASSIIKASPSFIFLLFGDKILLGSEPAWKTIFSQNVFSRILDNAMKLLFGWNMSQIDPESKKKFYRHLYSTTSVKSVVHWFQIITHPHHLTPTLSCSHLQMYDDTAHLSSRSFSRIKYDLSKFNVPCALFYGDADTIIDGPALVQMLGNAVVHVHVETEYEHLDFLWAKNVHERVYPGVMKVLSQFTTI